MEIKYRSILFFALRFSLYILLLIGLYFIYMYDATHTVNEFKITDTSATELFQEIFVFIAAGGFFLAGRKLKSLAPFTNLAALVFTMSFFRELNNLIEFWFYLVLPFMVWFAFLLVKNFKKVLAAFVDFTELKSSGAFFLGFLVTYVFSRFFGKKSLWMALLEDNYSRAAKNLAEEGIELLGYTLILISVIELLVFVFSAKKNQAGQSNSL